jgi:F-type H+-transporting ATPase subunit b
MGAIFGNPIFWETLAFLVFVGILLRFGYRRIVDSLDARADKIKTELDDARVLREDAQTLLASYQRKQRDAEKEAERIIEQAKDEASHVRAQAEADLQETLKRREDAAIEKIARAEAQALQDVRNSAVDAAIAAAATLIADNLDDAKSASLIDDATAGLGKTLH